MKKIILSSVLLSVLIFTSCKTTTELEKSYPTPSSSIDAVEFNEVWGYVMNKREKDYTPELPVTDIGYFISAVNTFSELDQVPTKGKFFSNTSARVHLVTSCDSKAQTHLLLSPEYSLRDKIIDQLIAATETYDGLQIDWELVPADDAEYFAQFLKILKSKLNGKMLSVAVPARIKTLEKDAYNYETISSIADRIIVMAYDQHWSTSKPGTIAGTDWCEKIADYALTKIEPDKLVMGMSFYGRAWRDDTEGGKAYIYSSTEKLIKEHKVKKIVRDEYLTPSFTFTKKLTITTWYDDAASLKLRTEMYRNKGIKNLSFWRIGQEDKNYWQYLKVDKNKQSLQLN